MASRTFVRYLALLMAVDAKAHCECSIRYAHRFSSRRAMAGGTRDPRRFHVAFMIVIDVAGQLVEPDPRNRAMLTLVLRHLLDLRVIRFDGAMASHAEIRRG